MTGWRDIARSSAAPRATGVGGGQQNEQVTRRGLILFAALGIAWGIPYLFIKVAVSELEPAMVVLARSGLAAILLLPLAFFRREVALVVRRWKPMLAYTIVEIILPWYFLSSAEQRLAQFDRGAAAGHRAARRRGHRVRDGPARAALAAELARHRPRNARRRGARRPRHRRLRPDRRRRDGGRRRSATRWVRRSSRGGCPTCPGVGVVAVSLAATAVVYVPFVLLTRRLADRVAVARRSSCRSSCSPWSAAPSRSCSWSASSPRSVPSRRPRSPTSIPPSPSSRASLVLGERVTVWTIVGFALVLAGSFLVTRRRRELVAAEGPEEACAEQGASPMQQALADRGRLEEPVGRHAPASGRMRAARAACRLTARLRVPRSAGQPRREFREHVAARRRAPRAAPTGPSTATAGRRGPGGSPRRGTCRSSSSAPGTARSRRPPRSRGRRGCARRARAARSSRE